MVPRKIEIKGKKQTNKRKKRKKKVSKSFKDSKTAL